MPDRDVLPLPALTDHPSVTWWDRASCAGRIAIFDNPDPGPALAACAACPVRDPCRAWALRTAVAGVAGGLTEDDRVVWRAACGAAEPRIHLADFLPEDVVAADIADESLPDRHLRLVWPAQR